MTRCLYPIAGQDLGGYRSSVKVARGYLERPIFVLHDLSIEEISNEKLAVQILSLQSD